MMRIKEFDPDQVTDVVMQVFWHKGFAATSVQDLVAATGLSRSSLYGTFKNKEALYQRALYRYHINTQKNIDLLSSDGPVKAIISQLFSRIIADEISDLQHRGCFMANASLELAGHDEKIAQSVRDNFQRLQIAFERLIQRGQQSGELSSQHSARALALFFVNTIQGIRVLSKACTEQNRQESLQNVVDIALNSL